MAKYDIEIIGVDGAHGANAIAAKKDKAADGLPGRDFGECDWRGRIPEAEKGDDGYNGEKGKDGQDGGGGDNAPSVNVNIGLFTGNMNLLVKAGNGGNGGNGAKGQKGGDGGKGGNGGTCPRSIHKTDFPGANGGHGGHGGSGGDGGKGGAKGYGGFIDIDYKGGPADLIAVTIAESSNGVGGKAEAGSIGGKGGKAGEAGPGSPVKGRDGTNGVAGLAPVPVTIVRPKSDVDLYKKFK
ncbi:MAG: hypothetical protein V4663_12380 [Bacteroidota bacterium]